MGLRIALGGLLKEWWRSTANISFGCHYLLYSKEALPMLAFLLFWLLWPALEQRYSSNLGWGHGFGGSSCRVGGELCL